MVNIKKMLIWRGCRTLGEFQLRLKLNKGQATHLNNVYSKASGRKPLTDLTEEAENSIKSFIDGLKR